jgi:hypothetical protein
MPVRRIYICFPWTYLTKYQTSSSNIRASVQFLTSTVFAGEDVECIITFKNTAPEIGPELSPARSPLYNGGPSGDRQRKITPIQGGPKPPISRHSSYGPNVPPHMRRPHHRPSLSLGNSSSRQASGELDGPPPSRPKNHGRSLSIISMGTDTTAGAGDQGKGVLEGGWKSGLSHSRASSGQVPRRGGGISPYIGMS